MPDVAANDILRKSIVKTLLYSDIFDYPLTPEEIFTRLGTNHVQLEDVEKELDGLKNSKIVFQFERFFAVRNEAGLAEKRRIGNRKAQSVLPKALRRARLISRFPFVRAVLVSGSLSKQYMDDHSDIDFFIITAPGRLWISRTLLVAFKHLFLFGSHKHFCVNYFIDYEHLEINEKNIFTATELATLLPMTGHVYCRQLMEHNQWLNEFFPNHKASATSDAADKEGVVKVLLERVLNIGGNYLDGAFMRLTYHRWKRLYAKQFSAPDFDIAFKTNKHISKGHPNHYQKKVTDLYQKKVEDFFKQNPQMV